MTADEAFESASAYERARENLRLRQIADEAAHELINSAGWSSGMHQRTAIRDAFDEFVDDALSWQAPCQR